MRIPLPKNSSLRYKRESIYPRIVRQKGRREYQVNFNQKNFKRVFLNWNFFTVFFSYTCYKQLPNCFFLFVYLFSIKKPKGNLNKFIDFSVVSWLVW